MGNLDAENKFHEAVEMFMPADKKMRKFERDPQLEKVFKGVIIYLDAAINGLDEIGKGRALMVKANSLWWLYILWQRTQKIFPMERNPLLDEGFKNIQDAIEILTRLQSNSDLAYAQTLYEFLKPEN